MKKIRFRKRCEYSDIREIIAGLLLIFMFLIISISFVHYICWDPLPGELLRSLVIFLFIPFVFLKID